jgi:hypothetical protein
MRNDEETASGTASPSGLANDVITFEAHLPTSRIVNSALNAKASP